MIRPRTINEITSRPNQESFFTNQRAIECGQNILSAMLLITMHGHKRDNLTTSVQLGI
jgi:hypothetical protein